MQPPDELMLQSFLPAMRQLVAHELRSRGLSQNKISAALGVTQASVSTYLSVRPGRAYSALAQFSMSADEAGLHASTLADSVLSSPSTGVRALERIWWDLLGSGSACAPHRAQHPSLSGCQVCIEAYGQEKGGRAEAIAEVAEAVSLIEASREFVRVMPEVSVNIACIAGEAKSPADVVAVPGRIVRVKDRAKALLPPEAGASAHMARVLLLARSRRPELRSCINLRFDGRIASVLRREGLRIIKLGRYRASETPDATTNALEKTLSSARGPFDAVVDEGASGIEPNVYLFAKRARDVALLALEIARAYSAA